MLIESETNRSKVKKIDWKFKKSITEIKIVNWGVKQN